MCTNGPPCPPGRACSATRTVGWPWMACAASPTSTSEEARMNENTRRTFLKAATTIPIIGGAVLAMHSILRYFKPTMVGGLDGLTAPPDTAPSPPQVAAELSDLQKPWDFKDFIYVRN